MVGEHLKQCRRERAEALALIRTDTVNLLADQGVHGEQQGQATILVTPLLKLGQVLERARLELELANIQVLQGNEKGVQLVHDLGFRAG